MKPEENGNMLFFKRLLTIALSAALLGPIAPLHARDRKGDKYLTEGRAYQAKKDWDAALEAYQKALAEDPSDIEYQMAAEKTRFQAGQMHVEKGVKIRGQGMLGEALLEFQRAFTVNPSSAVAVQEIRTTQDMIERERQRVLQTGKESNPEDRGLTPLQQLKKEQDQQLERLLPAPDLKPLSPRRIDLKINNANPQTLFNTLGKYAGINVLWDPEYGSGAGSSSVKAQSVDFQNSTLEEALDYLSIVTKSFWKPLSANTIFVTVDSRAKRNDYEDNVLRVFYLSNISTTAELQEIVNTIRTVTDTAHMFAFTGQNAIVVRGEVDKVRLVEKIIHDLDRPKAEVLMDIVVMETNSVYSRQLAAALAPTGLNIPGNFTPRSGLQVVTNANTTGTTTSGTSTTGTTTTGASTTGTTTTGTTSTATGAAIPLANLGHLASADWSTTLPSALLQAVMSDANSKVLQSPQLRSVDQVKATLKIGDREPVASGSFQPGIGGVGINPLVNTQFNYIDVGVNVDMTPHVHDNGDVSLHIELDISTVNGQVNLGGITQPIIGQRKVSHDIRLREGEVALLGGLTKLQDTKTKTGTPGLSSIPFLGRLFSGESIDRERSELMIAIVPHVIRRPEFTAENLRSIIVGSSQTIKLSYAPEEPPDGLAPAAAVAPVAPVAPPTGTAPAAATPAPQPAAPAPGGAALPATAPPVAGLPATAPPPSPGAPPAAAVTARFVPANIDAAASGTFSVEVALEGGTDVVSASPIQIGFDPKLLSLVDVAAGGLFSKDGQAPVFSRNIMNDMGLATIQCNRPPDAAGVTGPGTLLILRFQALGRGATSVTGNMSIRNSRGLVIGSPTPQLPVNLK
jgi:general secretion pathway protein D